MRLVGGSSSSDAAHGLLHGSIVPEHAIGERVHRIVLAWAAAHNALPPVQLPPPFDGRLQCAISSDAELPGHIAVISGLRTDLAGSFLQGVLGRVLHSLASGSANVAIAPTTPTKLADFTSFECQDARQLTAPGRTVSQDVYATVASSCGKAEHAEARQALLGVLFAHVRQRGAVERARVSCVGDDNFVGDLFEAGDAALGRRQQCVDHPTVVAFTAACRARLRPYLPVFLAQLAASGYVAIHYRAGEIVNMASRFLHSREYDAVLRAVRAAHPGLPLFVFTSEPPEEATDDLATFAAHGARVLRQRDCGIVATFAAFADARVLVMGKSSFSYAPALLRDAAAGLTVYRRFTHGRAHPRWRTWDARGMT